ncbi:MAG: hypothetical protein EOO39_35145, partial [Cytophagaceae bacterium]
MGIRSTFIKPLAQWVRQRQQSWREQPGEAQQRWFRQLVDRAAQTQFGRDHHFADIRTQADFRQAVPIRDYEALKPY